MKKLTKKLTINVLVFKCTIFVIMANLDPIFKKNRKTKLLTVKINIVTFFNLKKLYTTSKVQHSPQNLKWIEVAGNGNIQVNYKYFKLDYSTAFK